MSYLTWFFSLMMLASVAHAASPTAFEIQILDEETGRGVPLVELKTVHDIRFFTDSAGYAAIREPELMDQTVFFSVRSHGYEFPKDGFGIRGRGLKVTAGGRETLKIKRLNIAERLYRVTGAGIYADSVTLGHETPIEQPLSNALVMGSDSVVMTRYRDKIYWFWGDTNQFRYPLGNFNVTGATSKLPEAGGLSPALGVNFDYFKGDDGFAKPVAKMPGDGPTWIFGIVVLKSKDGRERMLTGYEKIRGTSMQVYERGICEFDDERQEFVKSISFAPDVPLYLHGHPFIHRDGEVDYVYFGDPYPVMRVKASLEAVLDLSQYEAFTCLEPGNRKTSAKVERSTDGKVVWGWKRDTAAISFGLQESLRKQQQLKDSDGWLRLTDVDSGKVIEAHRGSVTWNPHRNKWVLVTTQIRGTSMLGEVWYAEAERPEGPWVKAKKIMTHDKYSFYNPKQHPQFSVENGRYIFFEGTYTQTFSGNTDPTPRYEYNQMMYRIDLDDPRLKAAQN